MVAHSLEKNWIKARGRMERSLKLKRRSRKQAMLGNNRSRRKVLQQQDLKKTDRSNNKTKRVRQVSPV